MTNFLHWRKMTWILLLWSAAAVTWLLVADSGAAVVGLLWLLGTLGLGFVWSNTGRCSARDEASAAASSSSPAAGTGGW